MSDIHIVCPARARAVATTSLTGKRLEIVPAQFTETNGYSINAHIKLSDVLKTRSKEDVFITPVYPPTIVAKMKTMREMMSVTITYSLHPTVKHVCDRYIMKYEEVHYLYKMHRAHNTPVNIRRTLVRLTWAE